MKFNFYDLYCTVIKNRDQKKFVNEIKEDIVYDFYIFNDVVLNHYIGRKIIIEILSRDNWDLR